MWFTIECKENPHSEAFLSKYDGRYESIITCCRFEYLLNVENIFLFQFGENLKACQVNRIQLFYE